MVNVMSDKRTNRIRDQLEEEIEKLREEGEVPEILDLIRQIERAKSSKNLQRRIGFINNCSLAPGSCPCCDEDF
jgi:hypothetical protein